MAATYLNIGMIYLNPKVKVSDMWAVLMAGQECVVKCMSWAHVLVSWERPPGSGGAPEGMPP